MLQAALCQYSHNVALLSGSSLASMMNPQTPPRKLFKASSKTKTPTPVKRQRSRTPTLSSVQSHDALTPTETVSRGTDRPGAPESIQSAADSREGNVSGQTNSPVKSIAGKPRELLSPSTDDLPEASNPTDALNSPTDVAKYFAEQGNTEMSTFVSALAGKTMHHQMPSVGNHMDSDKRMSHFATDETKGTSEPMEELPRDDSLVVSPNERTKEALEEVTRDATSDVASSIKPNNSTQDRSFAEKTTDIPEPAENFKGAEGTMNDAKDQISGVEPTNATGEPNTSEISKEADLGISGVNETGQDAGFAGKTPTLSEPGDVFKRAEELTSGSKEQASATAPTKSNGEPGTSSIKKGAHVGMPNGKEKGVAEQKSPSSAPEVLEDGTRVADNMGQPSHIERRIEIPLPRPEKVVESPGQPTKPDTSNIATGLGDFEDLPGTEGLGSTDDLPGLPEDPPEEVLDPSVHSPSSNISPIPKIPKITPIGMAPPPDLLHLAHGLSGNTVDDVGNIIDVSGKVLGHATGDLPAMVGKKVEDNGEIYGDSGEVIGYVSENFTGQPTPADIPENVLGGLKVDHQGNILDTNGNIIGRFNEKAGKNGALAPFLKRPKTSNPQPEDDKPREEKKPKVNAQTGGSPSDIFLDVKSTTDGIQLTIRIPTTFGRQQEDS
ncbi:hypothetical protein F5Y06DRAFT_289385 [Hypoxylon sp. FL0890]|nr:hypothetical protein F5Y06DRAFT_289385 [Hypoxylon sp. FL0890]